MHRRVVVSMVAALVALLAVTAAQSKSSASEILIGWSGDKSGPTVASQAPALAGLRTYIKMINDAGGVNGKKIEMIEKDDAYNVAKELEIVKSFINDDKVDLVTGIGNSSGFASILPVLSASKTPALVNQGTLKSNTWPFQPGPTFQGNCNYGDQADVALAYTMTRAKIKDLKGVKVGIAGIEVASGQEWIQTLKDKVTAAGGIAVTQTLPAAIVSADVAVQAFESEKVQMILMHHSIAGGLAMLRSIAKFGLNVPISGSYGVGHGPRLHGGPVRGREELRAGQLLHGAHLLEAHGPRQAGLRHGQEGRRAGRPARAGQLLARLGQRHDHRRGPEDDQGRGHPGLDEEGPRVDQEPRHGRPLAEDLDGREVPHGDPRRAPGDLQLEQEGPAPGRLVRAVAEVRHQQPGRSRHLREEYGGK